MEKRTLASYEDISRYIEETIAPVADASSGLCVNTKRAVCANAADLLLLAESRNHLLDDVDADLYEEVHDILEYEGLYAADAAFTYVMYRKGLQSPVLEEEMEYMPYLCMFD